MAGCITAGRSKSCTTTATGGLLNIWLADASNVTSYTTAGTDGAVDTITMVALNYFYLMQFQRNTGGLEEVADNTNGLTVTQTLSATFKGKTQVDRNFIMEISTCNCGMAVIVEDQNGQKWIYGINEDDYAELQTATANTQLTRTDLSNVVLSFIAESNVLALQFEGTVPVAP